jgi:hypothetical protein
MTITATTAASHFNEMFDVIKNEIPFNVEWNNGTGYYDGACKGSDKVILEPGELAKSISPMPNNRKMIFVGTPVGTVVVFERFSGGENGVYVHNAAHHFISQLIQPQSPLSAHDMGSFLGQIWEKGDSNIGNRIHRLLKLLPKSE